MIKNVKKEEVFKLLSEGKEVYAINPITDNLKNLLYEEVNLVINWIKGNKNEFFVIEEEGAVAVYG